MKKYSKHDILKKCELAICDAASFYQQGFVNYTGVTSDTQEYYTEVVAKFVLEHLSAFKSIERISRKKCYYTKTHLGNYSSESNRKEELTAIQLYNQSIDNGGLEILGKVIDYQIPLKDSHTDKVGKIDMLSARDNTLYILELKRDTSRETMLKCVLEGYTYSRIVDINKLTTDYNLPHSMNVIVSPLVYYNSKQWKEMCEQRPHIKEIIRKLAIKPIFWTIEEGKYRIHQERFQFP